MLSSKPARQPSRRDCGTGCPRMPRTARSSASSKARMGPSTGHGEQTHRIENEKGAQSEQHHGEYPHRVEGPPNEVRLSCRASLTISQIEHYHSKTAPPASGAC